MSSTVQYRPGATIAPEFRSDKPGVYEIVVTIVGVPLTEQKTSFFDKSEWTAAFQRAGVNATADKIRFISSTNPRSTGGPLDYGGWGTPIADVQYGITLSYYGPGGGLKGHDGMGMGAVQIGGGAVLAIIGITVVASLLYYAFSGRDMIVDLVRYLGNVVRDVIKEGVIKPLGDIGIGVLVPFAIGAIILVYLLKKSGGRISTKYFSAGG